jgi:hypothetical protein
MPASPAQLLANRRNALLSTGPKTEAGKARSRRNSYKHGLTGDGVVVAPEVADEVNRRFDTLETEQKPSGEASRLFLRRFAYLSVRLEQSETFHDAAVSERVRHAIAHFDDARMTEIEGLVMHLASDPMTVARRLQTSPEGVDWLLSHWADLRSDLMVNDRKAWTINHWSRLEQLLGQPGGNFRTTRPFALTHALSGHFAHLGDHDGAGLDDDARAEWARAELATIIDNETARLRDVRSALDPAAVDRDRLEAPARALFDASPAMNLARRYEAATERAMLNAWDRFHDAELVALETGPIAANEIPESTCDAEMASFFPTSDRGLDPEIDPAAATPPSAYLREDGKARESRPKLEAKPRRKSKPKPMALTTAD